MDIRRHRLRLAHLYTDGDGESTVRDETYLLEPTEYGGAADIAVSGITFRLWEGAPPVHDLHNTSKPQLVIHLVGSVEVEGTDGTKRVLRPGEIMVSENTTGQGHYSNELEQPRLQLLIPYIHGFLPEAADEGSSGDSPAG